MNTTAWNETASFGLSSVTQKLTDCLQANDADLRPEAPFALAAAIAGIVCTRKKRG